MARPAGNADRRLIAAGKKIAGAQGCTGLRVRDVARRAGVNLGMFHYHFKSKRRFTRILLQELYDRFFERLTVASGEGRDARARLKASLLVMGKFIRDERHLLGALIKDVLNEDPEVLRFVRENVPRHAAVIWRLIGECRREGSVAEIPFVEAMPFIMSGLNAPTIIGDALERRRWRQARLLFTDAALERRVDWILKALEP
jgi:AcrR family transcriptional regulator